MNKDKKLKELKERRKKIFETIGKEYIDLHYSKKVLKESLEEYYEIEQNIYDLQE